MSSIIVVNAAEQAILSNHLAVINSFGGYSLRLFTNDVEAGLTPDEIDQLVVADFTEATFPGYAAVTVNSGWTFSQGNPTVATNTPRTFTRTSTGTPQDIRGYYLTFGASPLHWYEQFDGPVTVEFINDEIEVTPRLTIDDTEANVNPTGSIVAFGAATAPTGWLLCDGSAVSRTTFATLFAVIGTTYGTGDGSTTFNLPDLRQRFPLGKATSGTGATLGGTGGSIDHTHGLNTSTSHARVDIISGAVRSARKTVSSWTRNVSLAGTVTDPNPGSETNASELGGNSDTGNPPFQTVNFIVKT